MENKAIIVGIVIFVTVFLIFAAYRIYASETSFTSQTFIKAQNPSDKCTTPAGYTNEQWKEHMSHHPDMYKECLEDKNG